jgi:hypothetical protein
MSVIIGFITINIITNYTTKFTTNINNFDNKPTILQLAKVGGGYFGRDSSG